MEFENAFIKVVLCEIYKCLQVCEIYKCLQVCEIWKFDGDLLLSKNKCI